MKYLGSHIGLSAPDYFLGAAQEALSYDENAFMFYTGAPQNTKRKPVEEMKIAQGKELLKSHGVLLSSLVVHAPYIINLGNKDKPETYELGKSFLLSELKRTAAFGANKLVLHPGAHLGHGEDFGLESLKEALIDVLSQDDSGVTVCLETMAGKGSEIGVGFEFFARLFAKLPDTSRLGVCLDTCHIHDSGIDITNPSKVLDDFERIIGLNKLKVVHLNDSKNPCGARKDRHENLGYGCIGFDVLNAFAHEPRLDEVPIILETPWVEEKPPYKKEVALLVKGSFEPNWRESL